MLAIFLTRRPATILRGRTRRPHVVTRLTASIIGGIFARHRTVHVPPVLRVIHVTPVILWTIHFV